MARGAWDRTAAVRVTVAASMGVKDLENISWNPFRPAVRKEGTIDHLIGGVKAATKYGKRRRKG